MDRHKLRVDASLAAAAYCEGPSGPATRHLKIAIEEACGGYLITLVDTESIFDELSASDQTIPRTSSASFKYFYHHIALMSARLAADAFVDEQICPGRWVSGRDLYAVTTALSLRYFAKLLFNFHETIDAA
jgi:hypothetical protein